VEHLPAPERAVRLGHHVRRPRGSLGTDTRQLTAAQPADLLAPVPVPDIVSAALRKTRDRNGSWTSADSPRARPLRLLMPSFPTRLTSPLLN
jgi:hypothetical protein